MGTIFSNLTEAIGRTPLVAISRLTRHEGIEARILVKIESFNPGGSVKDRVAFAMIEDAERRGLLRAGGTVVEPTSGNTGIGLAWVAAVKGYRAVLTMPETMSIERRKLLAAYGAELVLTPGSEGMKGAIRRARQIVEETPGAFMPGQFDNAVNPATHERTTAEEIWEDTEGKVDVLVAGVGTGGTLSGCGRRLKSLSPALRVVAVEPASSAVLSGQPSGKHGIQGIGAGFVPGNFEASVPDEILPIADEEAYAAARLLARQEGILAGISSGAALAAALKLAKRPENKGKTLVAVLPDTGERYLSTPLFADTGK
ncbi:MAG: cysteine synthase A [Alloprevotella sp.]